MEKNCFDVALKKSTKINKRSPSNKTVALRKKVRINNRRGYYYSIGKSTYSCVPIKRAGSIKRAGRNFHEKSKNEQALLSEQAGIFVKILKMCRP